MKDKVELPSACDRCDWNNADFCKVVEHRRFEKGMVMQVDMVRFRELNLVSAFCVGVGCSCVDVLGRKLVKAEGFCWGACCSASVMKIGFLGAASCCLEVAASLRVLL